METTPIEKCFVQNGIKSRKIFSAHQYQVFQKISTLNICDGAKQIYPKKQKDFKEKQLYEFQ